MRIFKLSTVLVALLMLSSCGDDEGNLLADFQNELSNTPDQFALQVSEIMEVTDNVEYTWNITGEVASVDQSTVLSTGTAMIEISDSNGTIVYNKDLTVDGNFDYGSWVFWQLEDCTQIDQCKPVLSISGCKRNSHRF